MSATPVREAVGQLASEGFVELVLQLGALVRELTCEEAVELYELREALKSFAAERVAERVHERQLTALAAHLSKSGKLVVRVQASGKGVASASVAKQFHTLDLAFLMTIIDASRNRRMLKVVGDSHILTSIFHADRHPFTVEILKATQAEHQEIFEAIRSGDPTAARDAMRQHIRHRLDLTLTETDDNAIDRWWAK